MVELHKKVIAISGLSGFVGKNLDQYLRGKLDIKSLARELLPEVTPSDLSGCNSIIHLAGKAHDLKSVSSSDEYYQINFALTCKLYDAFLQSDVEKFIFVSSVKAAADSLQGPLTEAHEPDPKTHYGISKLKAEQYIMSKPLPEGKSYYILRPCMIHGPGNKGNLNLLYKFVATGIPYPLAAYHNQRSFLSVENLCFVLENLIESTAVPFGVYQVADDETLSSTELVRLIAEASNQPARLWEVSPSIIKVLAKLGDVLRLPFNTEKINKLTDSYIVDNTKLRKVLGRDLPVSVREGIVRTVRSFDAVI